MGRHITFDAVRNFRDLGGYRGAEGRAVRWGRLFRSATPAGLTERDRERFHDLGIRTVIDLRYPWEVERSGRIPHLPGLAYHNLSIEHRPYDQASQAPDVVPGPFLAGKYVEVAEDGVAEIRRALEIIADDTGPLLFHCQSGKDRTGLLAMLVLTLLGVSDDDIVTDYTLTELATADLLADWHAAHPDRTLSWPAYCSAPAEIMHLFMADLTTRYGSVTGYATERLGVDDALVTAVRKRLLEE